MKQPILLKTKTEHFKNSGRVYSIPILPMSAASCGFFVWSDVHTRGPPRTKLCKLRWVRCTRQVAIKFQLMGREDKGTPQGKDLNSSLFDAWCIAEDWLSDWPESPLHSAKVGADRPSVLRAYNLCRFLRQHAWKIHDRIVSKLDRKKKSQVVFNLSYDAALLFHTLHAIRYDSLPHLKRIFAVYSASKILDHMQSHNRR